MSLAHKDMEPELECFDAQSRKSEGFGELKGGFMVKCSLGMCRLCVASLVVDALADVFYFKITQPSTFSASTSWVTVSVGGGGGGERTGLDTGWGS